MTMTFSIDAFLSAPPLDRARVVEEGLPARAVRELVADPAVTLADLSGIVAKRRTLDRRLAQDEPLTLEESDRLARFLEVLALAALVFGSRGAAMEWLRAPQYRFDAARPIDLLRTHSGSDLVANLLQLSRHGMLA